MIICKHTAPILKHWEHSDEGDFMFDRYNLYLYTDSAKYNYLRDTVLEGKVIRFPERSFTQNVVEYAQSF